MKRSFTNYARIYLMMISQDFKSKMAYRADFIISTAAMVLMNFGGLASFWLIFNSIPAIKGFSYDELIFMYGFSILAATPLQLFFDNLWQLWIVTLNGDFIKYCFKPLNLFFYFVAETFDVKGLGQLLFGIITFVYGWNRLNIPVNLTNITMLVFSLIGASLVLIGIMVFASVGSFITIHGATIMIFFIRFRDYARYPMTIFNAFFKFVFTFIIPIGFLSFYPAMFFLRPESHLLMAFLSPVVGILIFYLAYKLWLHVATKYAGTGT